MAIGLTSGHIRVYDVRDMQLAQQLEAPFQAAVSKLSFSNKGIFLAASWEGQDTCRVYSLHKAFAANDIKQEGLAVTSLSFDFYGGFLAIGTTQNLMISSYKNWKKTLTTINPFQSGGVKAINFDATGRKIFVSNCVSGEIKTLGLQ